MARQLGRVTAETRSSVPRMSQVPHLAGGPRVGRTVIIANRGPNDFAWNGGGWTTRPGSGGLVSLLTPFARKAHVTWVCCVSEPPDAAIERGSLFMTAADQTDPDIDVLPVPMPARVYRDYYGRISNEVLWKLHHRVMGAGGFESVDHVDHAAWTHGYLEANARLARFVAKACQEPRALLVHDYHLYPLPALLRARFPTAPILHFTHTRFPHVDLLRLLPPDWRTGILRGLLGADIVGLQTDGDRHAFLQSCRDLLGVRVDTHASMVESEDGRAVRVGRYPAGVDPEALEQEMQSGPVSVARAAQKDPAGGLAILRVDRLDPSRNQLVGLRAFARLLESRPDLRGRARYFAMFVPSRTDLEIYKSYKESVYALAKQINDELEGACGGPPIEIHYTSDRAATLAAMESCDVLLVNSLVDGMNLVAKEWAIVSRRPGVLVVSETEGVAEEAEGAALAVSPLDVEGTALALAKACDLSKDERQDRLDNYREKVIRWTAASWLDAQLEDLGLAGEALSAE
jgi:trehalose 6-phosphate synthase